MTVVGNVLVFTRHCSSMIVYIKIHVAVRFHSVHSTDTPYDSTIPTSVEEKVHEIYDRWRLHTLCPFKVGRSLDNDAFAITYTCM